MADYKLVLIIWEDSQLGFQGWKFINEQPKDVALVKSVGFLTYEDEKCKVLYPHLHDAVNEDEISGSGDIKIPNSAIKSITELQYSIAS